MKIGTAYLAISILDNIRNSLQSIFILLSIYLIIILIISGFLSLDPSEEDEERVKNFLSTAKKLFCWLIALMVFTSFIPKKNDLIIMITANSTQSYFESGELKKDAGNLIKLIEDTVKRLNVLNKETVN